MLTGKKVAVHVGIRQSFPQKLLLSTDPKDVRRSTGSFWKNILVRDHSQHGGLKAGAGLSRLGGKWF